MLPQELAIGPVCPRYLVGFDLRRRPHLEADVLLVGGGVALKWLESEPKSPIEATLELVPDP